MVQYYFLIVLVEVGKVNKSSWFNSIDKKSKVKR